MAKISSDDCRQAVRASRKCEDSHFAETTGHRAQSFGKAMESRDDVPVTFQVTACQNRELLVVLDENDSPGTGRDRAWSDVRNRSESKRSVTLHDIRA